MILMRTHRLELRLTDDERQLDSAAATAVRETLSDFFRRAASVRAREVLADQQQIVLSEDEAVRFLDALDAVDHDTVVRLRDLRKRTCAAASVAPNASTAPDPRSLKERGEQSFHRGSRS
jgi:uncharacterized protein (DUF1778 family)